MKSERAKLTTKRFDGVLNPFVFVKMYMTQRFPRYAMTQNITKTNPNIECHNGFIGGY